MNVCVLGTVGVLGLMGVQVVDRQTEMFEESAELEAQKDRKL